MKKFALDIINSDILLFQQQAKAGKIEEIIIEPTDGSLLGFGLKFHKETKVIPVSEILTFGPSFIVIKDFTSLSAPEDVIRIERAFKIDAKIIGEKVETESGQKLGKVTNYTLDLKNLVIDKIYVRPIFGLKFLAEDLIISSKNIIEIKKEKIIVTDTFAKTRRKAPASIAISPALD